MVHLFDDDGNEIEHVGLCCICKTALVEYGYPYCLSCEEEMWDDMFEADCVDDNLE